MSQKKRKGAVLEALLADNSPGQEAENVPLEPVCEPLSASNVAGIKANIAYIERHIMEAKTYSARLYDAPQDGNTLLKMLEELEKTRISARQIIDQILLPDSQKQALLRVGIKDISISNPSVPALLLITLFPLVNTQIKGGYNVYFEVKFALEKYLQEHPLTLPMGRFALVYRRIIKGNLALSAGHCDNDNFEMKRVTNAITEAIHVADSVDKFSFYYTAAAGDEAKTEVYLATESQFPDLIKTFISEP